MPSWWWRASPNCCAPPRSGSTASMLRQWRAPASKSTRSATAIAARLRSCSATCLLAAAEAPWSPPPIRLLPVPAPRPPHPAGPRGSPDLVDRKAQVEVAVCREVEALARAAVRSNRDMAGKAQGEAEVLVLAEVWAPVKPKGKVRLALYPLVRARGPARAELMRREQAARVVA